MSLKDPITCFDNSECIYVKCPLFNEALDTCKLEPLKGSGAPVARPEEPDVKIPYPIVTTILKKKPSLTFESVKALAETEVAKAAGLLTEEAAYYLVASNLGVYAEEESDVTLALKDYVDDLDFSEAPESISPKKFMGDKWGDVMEILRPLGYGWVRDGRNSHWEAGKGGPPKRDLSGIVKSTVEVDVSAIEWKVKDGDETVEARSGEKAWAFVMGWDKDAKKSTGQPKYSTQALHDYLQQTDDYCDGEYAYFMSKDAAFFNREPLP